MPLHTPIPLGPFLIDAEGRLAPRADDAFPAFTFRWRGRSVHASLSHVDPQDGRLKLQAVLGRVPSTAENRKTAPRPTSFASLRAVRRDLPEDWTMRLLPDHSALLEAEAAIPLPITATGLVTELTRFLLVLAPYLDLLDETGVTAPVASDGMANN
jgi:hypothetical protein